MSDAPLTASAIMTYTADLEDRSAALYGELSARYPEQAKLFSRCAKDCAKHQTQLVRTYQETVTDALETGFSFEGIVLRDYAVETALPGGSDLAADLAVAVALEEQAIAFYEIVAERSASLLATIPRAFLRVAKKRQQRLDALKELAG